MSTLTMTNPSIPTDVVECMDEGMHNVRVDPNGYCKFCGYLDLGICRHTGGGDRECECMGWQG